MSCSCATWKKGDLPVYFAGDYTEHAKSELMKLLKQSKNFTAGNLIDMEPFQIISAMLAAPNREREQHLIGGAPQLLKVYKSLNRVPFAVKWRMKDKEETTLFGMPVHPISGFPYPIIDPNALKISNSNSYKSAA